MLLKPCGVCPFKKNSIKGYLGGFSVEETLLVARSDSSFICHKTRESFNEEECVGRLLFATNTYKKFKGEELEEMRIIANENNSLDNILGFDFSEHHKE